MYNIVYVISSLLKMRHASYLRNFVLFDSNSVSQSKKLNVCTYFSDLYRIQLIPKILNVLKYCQFSTCIETVLLISQLGLLLVWCEEGVGPNYIAHNNLCIYQILSLIQVRFNRQYYTLGSSLGVCNSEFTTLMSSFGW